MGVLFYSLAYFAAYKYGASAYNLSALQGNLNRNAEDLAKKYGIKKEDEYAQWIIISFERLQSLFSQKLKSLQLVLSKLLCII